MKERIRLLAGSIGPERVAARPDPRDARWFEPPHVRDPRGARERIAGQVTAGADVVVAPTWLTHRRALLPLGETRQARAWTAAAVRVAREAVESGLERRHAVHRDDTDRDDIGGDEAPREPASGLALERPVPLIAAVLPALDEEPEPGSGRLLPREAASERDYRHQAGLLADAEPDLILVTSQRQETEARTAIREASDLGLPIWAALERAAVTGDDPGPWLSFGHDAGLDCLLLPRGVDANPAAGGAMPWGAIVTASADAARASAGVGPSVGGHGPSVGGHGPSTLIGAWLDMGARVIARLDGASADAIEPLRSAIDEHERAELEAAGIAGRRWREHVATAAAMAPGGAAVWLGRPPDQPPPTGFEWLMLGAEKMPHLPSDHFRLVVLDAGPESLSASGRLLERGGIVAAAGEVLAPGRELRLVMRSEAGGQPLTIHRRED